MHKLRTEKDNDLHEMIDFLVFDKKRLFSIEDIVNQLLRFQELPEGECDFVHKPYITRQYLRKVVKAKVHIYHKAKKLLRMPKGKYLVL